jgi:hypothetical protein
VLYALEAAEFSGNRAVMRVIFPNGTFGEGFAVFGDDSTNFFAGGMAYDPWSDQLLVTDNTADGRVYAITKTGAKQTLATGLAGVAGVAVRSTGEIFVSTAPFGRPGEVLLVDRMSGAATPVLSGLGFGAGLAFDLAEDLIVQDADAATFRGRLQRLPISETPGGLAFGTPVPILDDMQSAAGVVVDSEGDIFTTGSGGLFRVAGSPPAEVPFDDNGNAFQFATAIAFDAGLQPFERFAGPDGGRLTYMADFGFATQDTFVTLLTPAVPGDYNGDGSVDESDYAAWRGGFASMSDHGNGDGVVDAADYVIWRKHAALSGAGSAAVNSQNVPEPATAILAVLIAASINFRRRMSAKPAGSA